MLEDCRSVLIIEDDPTLRLALSEGIAHAGYTVYQADNGELGLTMALKEQPDLVILDMIMPGFNGSAVLHGLRKDGWGESVPVIVLTNLMSYTKQKDSEEHNVVGYFIKVDTSLKKLVEIIHKTIGGPHLSSAASHALI
jgi:DNA-binding response OmpR family regulator